MSMKMIDDDKIFKYVREKILGKEDIEKIVEKFKDSEEIYNVVKKLVDFFMLENYFFHKYRIKILFSSK